jgi:KDO2-lipid IV(A) lauroyltransferase
MKHKPQHYIEYLVMLFFQTVIRILPLRAVVYIAKYLARIISIFYKPRYSTSMKNLRIAFPGMNREQKKRIVLECYEHIIMASFESYKYMYLTQKQKLKHLKMEEKSLELIKRINSEGRGCVVVGGHYGFFEAGGHFATCHGIKSAYVVANQKNKLTEKLIDIPREKSGLLVIHRKSMIKLFRALRDNYFVALLSDQNAGRKHGVFVDFFGKQASTHKNPAVISLKHKVPMLIVNTVRRKDDITVHDLSFDEIPFGDILKEDSAFDDKVHKLVQRYTKALEDRIRQEPSHYWWIHKRYKTRPK